MINSFDRLKISIPLTEVCRKNDSFGKFYGTDGVLSFESHSSIGLRIKINHKMKEMSLDVSAKILGERYFEHISIKTVPHIIKRIQSVIDIPAKTFFKGTPRYCEIVRDVKVTSPSQVIDQLFRLSKLQNKFKTPPRSYKHLRESTSFYLTKNVNTREIKSHISIYNKNVELTDPSKYENAAFLDSLPVQDRLQLIQSSEGLLRTELKLSSKRLMRSMLDLEGEFNLYSLLTSHVNVTKEQLSGIYSTKIKEFEAMPDLSHKEFDRYNTLRFYEFDLEKILVMHRSLGNTRESSKILKPYRDIMGHSLKGDSVDTALVKELIEKL